jgi:hypothetical protein
VKGVLKNGMAMENFVVSVLFDAGSGYVFLYHLAADASRTEMVEE